MQYARKHEDNTIEYPYTHDMLRASMPDICWPSRLSEASLADYGVQYVAPGQRPSYNQATHKIICRIDITTSPWSEVWHILEMVKEEQETVLIAESERIRSQRDSFLADMDSISSIRWAMMAKTQQTAWKKYRQALLDVPEQSGFPFAVNWPLLPN